MLSTETHLDPRVRRTRQLLQSALAELLKEKKIHDVTVQDIAARAGINRATFYARFEDKYDLLNSSVREMFQEKLSSRLPTTPAFTPEHLRLLALTVFEYVGGFLGHCAPTGQNSDDAVMMIAVQTSVYETLLKWLESSPQQQTPPETIALTTSWAIFGSALQWTRTNRRHSPETLVEQIMPLLLNGLGAYLAEAVA